MALFTAFVWLNLLFHFRPLTETYQPLTYLPTAGLLVFWIMIAYRAHRRTAPRDA